MCSMCFSRCPLQKGQCQLKQPFDFCHAVPDELLRVIFDILFLGPVEIATRSASKLKQWVSIAKNLEMDKTKLKEGMEPVVEAILQPRRSFYGPGPDHMGWCCNCQSVNGQTCCFPLKDGTILDVSVHSLYLGDSRGQPLTSVLDLSNATSPHEMAVGFGDGCSMLALL